MTSGASILACHGTVGKLPSRLEDPAAIPFFPCSLPRLLATQRRTDSPPRSFWTHAEG